MNTPGVVYCEEQTTMLVYEDNVCLFLFPLIIRNVRNGNGRKRVEDG